MAAESFLVDDLAADVMERLANTRTISSALDTRIRRALDTSLREYVSETRPQDLITTTTKSVTSGTAEWAAPDDFLCFMPDGVRLNVTDYRKLMYITREQYDRMELERSQATGIPRFYYPKFRKASDGLFYYGVWPTPSANTTLRLYYIPIPTSIRSSTSGDGTKIDWRVPTMWLSYLVEGALRHFSDYLDGTTLALAEKMWQDALRMGSDMAVKQAGEPIIPDEFLGGRLRAEGPIPPLTLT